MPYTIHLFKQIIFASALIFISISSKAQSNKVDTVEIKLKEKLVFEAVVDSANNLSLVKTSNEVKEKTITIELKHEGSAGTFLKIYNPLQQDIIYKAEIYLPKKKSWIDTDVIPVSAKLFSYETWPYKIEKIRLLGFALVSKK